MILNISGRTDIVAFYTPWFMKRLKEGFVDVRNPFNESQVSRIYFEDVEMFVFCTKNPRPIIPYLKDIKKPILFHVTLTGYHKDIEVNVKDKKEIINDIKEISKIIGKSNVYVRYDPIFLNDKYTVDYHIKAIKKLAEELEGYIEKIIISFIDDYKNVRKNERVLNYREFKEIDYKTLGESISKECHKHHIRVHTCFEKRNLVEYGFDEEVCLSHELAYMLTGKKYPNWKARREGLCNCVNIVDIGVFNTCFHFCKYCYANFKEEDVLKNRRLHDPSSTMLIGKLKDTDKVTIRRK